MTSRALFSRACARLRYAFSERRCLACASVFIPVAEALSPLFCPTCLTALARREQGYCPDCGEPAAWPHLPIAPCRKCLEHPPVWKNFLFHGIYEGQLRQMLLALKFGGQAGLGCALGGLLAGHPSFGGITPDAVVPIPLHTLRLRERGYNQALEIARPLAKRMGLPLQPSLLTRIRNTPPQSGLTTARRQKNILQAFHCDKKVSGRHLLLIDDTFTTGATLEAASAALLHAGAAYVSVAVVSRTPRRYGLPLR